MIKKTLITGFITAVFSATALGGIFASAATVTVEPSDSIQDAIDSASAGDVINIAAGTYTEAIIVNKPLTIRGAQAGVSAVNRSGSETVIKTPATSTRTIRVQANDVTLDGLTLDGQDGQEAGSPNGPNGVFIQGSEKATNNLHNTRLVNTVFKNFKQRGVYALGLDASGFEASHNLFTDNNVAGIQFISAWGDGIKISDNSFGVTGSNTSNYALYLQGQQSAPGNSLTNVAIIGNTSNQVGTFLNVYGAKNVKIADNTVTNTGAVALGIGFKSSQYPYDAVEGLVIQGNTLQGGTGYGILFKGGQPTTDVEIKSNTISGYSSGVTVREGTVNGDFALNENHITGNTVGAENLSDKEINANNNYWGCAAGPGAEGCDSVEGVILSSSWYTDDSLTVTNVDIDADDSEAAPGVPNTSQSASRIGVTVAAIAGAATLVTAAVILYRRRSLKS